MKRGQLAIVVLAAAAVAVVALLTSGDGGEDRGGPEGAPAGAVQITFAYSPEKEKLLVPLIRSFNDAEEDVRGKAVVVEGEVVSSGEAESKIADGRLEPVAWSPASSLW